MSMPQPIGQTFKVDTYGGCFLTAVELYFAYKDENLPVWVEIRNTIAGQPGRMMLPHSRKVLEPDQINLNTTDGTTSTLFRFDSPVFVQEGKEYALVVRTNSTDYRIWTSQLGEIDLSTGSLIDTQPELGVLFKSSNDSTWASAQMEDMKFTLYKAKFPLEVEGVVTLNNSIIGNQKTFPDNSADGLGTMFGKRLLGNPITLTHNSTTVNILHLDHGMYSTSNNVEIRGATSGLSTLLNGVIISTATSLVLAPSVTGGSSVTGFEASNESSKIYLKINNEIMKGTLSGLNVTSITRALDSTTAVSHASGSTVELYQINKTPLTEINKVFNAISNIQLNSYTITLTTAPTVTGSDATPEVRVGGTNVFASENFRFETMRTIVETLELPQTLLTAKVGTTSGTSPSGSETSFSKLSIDEVDISLNSTVDFERTNIIASPVNETNELSGQKSLSLALTMKTANTNLSPVIDLDRASAVVVGNIINNIDSSSDVYPTSDFNASTEVDGDQNAAIYITKKIALENPATSLKVTFAAVKPATSDIKVLFKVLRSDDSFDFDELGYEFFNTDGSPDASVNVSLTKGDFQDYTYSAGIKDDGTGTDLGEFIQFAIKIVMQGTDASQPPRIKQLRAIALAT